MGVVGWQSDKPKIERKSKAGCVLSRKEEQKEENKEQQQPQHSACLVHATQSVILDSNPENRGFHNKKCCLVREISMRN